MSSKVQLKSGSETKNKFFLILLEILNSKSCDKIYEFLQHIHIVAHAASFECHQVPSEGAKKKNGKIIHAVTNASSIFQLKISCFIFL